MAPFKYIFGMALNKVQFKQQLKLHGILFFIFVIIDILAIINEPLHEVNDLSFLLSKMYLIFGIGIGGGAFILIFIASLFIKLNKKSFYNVIYNKKCCWIGINNFAISEDLNYFFYEPFLTMTTQIISTQDLRHFELIDKEYQISRGGDYHQDMIIYLKNNRKIKAVISVDVGNKEIKTHNQLLVDTLNVILNNINPVTLMND